MARLIPSEYLLFREHLMIADCMRCTILHMFIDIIADKHIHTLAVLSELFQSIQHNPVAVCIQPVVWIHNLEIHASGIGNTGIHCTTMTCILLMDRTADPRILCFIFIRNGSCAIAGTVIYNNNLHVLAARQQWINTLAHISFRVVARNRKRQNLQSSQPPD